MNNILSKITHSLSAYGMLIVFALLFCTIAAILNDITIADKQNVDIVVEHNGQICIYGNVPESQSSTLTLYDNGNHELVFWVVTVHCGDIGGPLLAQPLNRNAYALTRKPALINACYISGHRRLLDLIFSKWFNFKR